MKNCFDRTPHTMKDWLLLAAGVAAVFAAADWLPGVLRGAGAFLGLLAPFGWGLLLAYVLDIPTRFFAKKLFGGRRGGAMAVSYALFFGALALLADVLNPETIVIGSVYVRCEELLREAMWRALRREALTQTVEGLQVLPAQTGEQIGDLAAVMVAEYGLAKKRGL